MRGHTRSHDTLTECDEQWDGRPAIERGERGFYTGWFVERAQSVKDRPRRSSNARRRNIPDGLAQGGACDHRPREIVAGADAFQNTHRHLNIGLGSRRR